MNCSVPDNHCREVNQAKEKDAIWKFSDECELYAPETKTFRRAAILARRASNSGANGQSGECVEIKLYDQRRVQRVHRRNMIKGYIPSCLVGDVATTLRIR